MVREKSRGWGMKRRSVVVEEWGAVGWRRHAE